MKKVHYRKIASGIYQLEKDFCIITRVYPFATVSSGYITLGVDGLLILRKGYVSDGPSGPTFDTKSSIRGAFVHDALYRLMRAGLLSQDFRKESDEEIRDLCIEDGMYKWRAKAWYHSLRLFGGCNAKYKDSQILIAP